jgi:hypothetical protein
LQEHYEVTVRSHFLKEICVLNGVSRRVIGAVIYEYQRAIGDRFVRGHRHDESPLQATNHQVEHVIACGEAIEGWWSRRCGMVTTRSLCNGQSTRGTTYADWPRDNRKNQHRGHEASTHSTLL